MHVHNNIFIIYNIMYIIYIISCRKLDFCMLYKDKSNFEFDIIIGCSFIVLGSQNSFKCDINLF